MAVAPDIPQLADGVAAGEKIEIRERSDLFYNLSLGQRDGESRTPGVPFDRAISGFTSAGRPFL